MAESKLYRVLDISLMNEQHLLLEVAQFQKASHQFENVSGVSGPRPWYECTYIFTSLSLPSGTPVLAPKIPRWLKNWLCMVNLPVLVV